MLGKSPKYPAKNRETASVVSQSSVYAPRNYNCRTQNDLMTDYEFASRSCYYVILFPNQQIPKVAGMGFVLNKNEIIIQQFLRFFQYRDFNFYYVNQNLRLHCQHSRIPIGFID